MAANGEETRQKPALSEYMPASASPNFAALLTNLHDLINALEAHPAYPEASKLATPARPTAIDKQNKIYFMHDFCARSRYNLLQIDPKLKAKKAKEDFREIYERSIFSNILAHDTSGKLSMLTFEKPGEEIDFGPEVRAAAAKIGNLPDEAAALNF